MTINQLTDLRIEQILEKVGVFNLDKSSDLEDVASALRELQVRRKAAEPVGEDELDHLIWGLERYGLYPRQLAALKELRELRMAKRSAESSQDARRRRNRESNARARANETPEQRADRQKRNRERMRKKRTGGGA